MNNNTVFYSWQSDLPHETNYEFIKKSIENALINVNENLEIHSSPRDFNQLLELDHDTKDIAGSPPIVDTIFDKIDNCSIFIADLSFVGITEQNDQTDLVKMLPNPNVLIEYGYAYKSIGYNRIIGVMNSAFGEPTPFNMPFNLRHIKFPIEYELYPKFDSQSEQMNSALLVNKLEEKIKLISSTNQNLMHSLSTELLEDNSKFYILKNKKVLLILHLKTSNKNNDPASFNVSKLEFMIDNEWVEADKSKFNGERIETFNRGSVIPRFLENKIIKYEQDARLEGMSSIDLYFAFELHTNNYEQIIINSDTLSVRGEVISLDGSNSYFEGVVKAYK